MKPWWLPLIAVSGALVGTMAGYIVTAVVKGSTNNSVGWSLPGFLTVPLGLTVLCWPVVIVVLAVHWVSHHRDAMERWFGYEWAPSHRELRGYLRESRARRRATAPRSRHRSRGGHGALAAEGGYPRFAAYKGLLSLPYLGATA